MLGLGFFLLLGAQEHDDRFNFFCVQFIAKRTHRGIRDAFGNITGDGVVGFAELKLSADQAGCARAFAAGAVAKAAALFTEASLAEFDRGFVVGSDGRGWRQGECE